jgi:hypothetical protein
MAYPFGMQEPAAPEGSYPLLSAIQTWIPDNIAWAAPLLALITVSVKLFAVGGNNFTTAVALLQEIGAVDVSVGILITGLPSLGGVLFALLLGFAVMESLIKGDSAAPWLVLNGVFALVLATFVPWPLLLAYTVLFGLCIGAGIVGRAMSILATTRSLGGTVTSLRASLRPSSTGSLRSHMVPAAIALFPIAWLLIAGSAVPWAPLEAFRLNNGDAIVGYQVGDESRWVTILLSSPRQVVRVPLDDINHRELCTKAGKDTRPSLLGLIAPDLTSDPPKYKACPVAP